jgi:hypothetical protein
MNDLSRGVAQQCCDRQFRQNRGKTTPSVFPFGVRAIPSLAPLLLVFLFIWCFFPENEKMKSRSQQKKHDKSSKN